ncbi:hypothetical protein MUO14_20385 [Halobacillus shinanisalinarum]|uniref:DUF4901 domain-containing protein n=1 Tax=Halobacillus shinanisalinarum TaxID=2932258 RepID=A0ABY4GXW5_9BACI|nr:hypothetical protein [Halobacillus shinanisalinarum]UOQ92748.1 hypothetical protein MUO14_20385 [Halobacillus shinanisalinarum]
MDSRIKELMDVTKTRFGLDNYYLKRHGLDRYVNIFNETVYTLSMDWFPDHVEEPEDDSNPEGTAVIEVNVYSHKFVSAIFVMDKTYAKNGISFAGLHTNDIIKWMEQESGLTYGRQLQLHKEEEGRLLFKEVIDGVAVSPSGSVEIKFDEEGKLTLFAVHGQFPSKEIIKEETYKLSFEKVEHLAKEQLKLIEFPSHEQQRLIPAYGVEEVYVTNDQMTTIPFEVIVDVRSYIKIDKTIFLDKTIKDPFERKEFSWTEEVTVEQAFSSEQSPDSYPITKKEQETCVLAVKDFLRQEYPDDSGIWILKTLHRNRGYIHATLRANKQDNRVFQRKLMVIIDATSFQAVNYVDNKSMLEMFDQFQAPDKVAIDKEEAYKKLKELFELKPYYVYDFEQKQYVLCGKLDCQYGVNASSGKVIALNDL